jgi:myo-inositol-1(or 4)-monophosphatase
MRTASTSIEPDGQKRPDGPLAARLATIRQAVELVAHDTGAWLQAQRPRIAGLAVHTKQAGDVASAIDAEAEALLRERLLPLWPGAGFHGEEGGGTPLDAPAVWVVDPLDGSANYLRGYPFYAVSIALLLDGVPVLGVVQDPCRDETFSAHLGGGATANGRALRCASVADPLQALAATVFPKPHSPRMAAYLAELGRVLPAVGGLRRSGAMALELAHLAAGRIDAFWEHDMAPWDAAAALVMLQEVGVPVLARDHLPLLHSASLVACTPAIADSFLALLEGAAR